MISKDTHNNNTNKAWERLHSKLAAEGLISNEISPKKVINSKPRNFGRIYSLAGAAMVLLILSALYLLINPNIYRDNNVIKLSNSEDQAISVTTLKDGSTVYMASKTSISYSKNFSEHSREVSLKGDAYFEVKSNENSPFIVQAPTFTIKVLGTSFVINYDTNGNPVITVESGKVSIRLKKTGEEKTLYAGEATSIQEETFTNNTPLTLNSFFAKTNKMHFKDQMLKNVVRVLNQKYPNSPILLSPNTEQRIITATFSGESSDSMAQMISIALNLNYRIQDGIITIYE